MFHLVSFLFQSFARLFSFLSNCLLDRTPSITQLLRCCIICILSSLLCALPSFSNTLFYVFFAFLKFWAFISCCFFYTLFCILCTLLKVLLCIFSFTFCISSCPFLQFLLSFFSCWFLRHRCLFKWLFRLLGTLLKFLFSLFGFTLSISSNNLAYLLWGLFIDILGAFF